MNRRPSAAVHIALGVMLVVVGSIMLLQRAGTVTWGARVSLVPVLLIGIGLAKLIETHARRSRRGYVALVLGLWLLAGDLGWVVLHDTWPLLLVGIGTAIVVDSMWAPAPRQPGAPMDVHRAGGFSPLMVAGIILAVALSINSRAFFPPSIADSSDRVQMFSLMTRSRQISQSQQFRGGEIDTLMGLSEVDFRRVTPAPGEVISLKIQTVMGRTILRVPRQWTIDVQTLSMAGGVVDRRSPAASAAGDPPAHVTLRGVILMGQLVIRS